MWKDVHREEMLRSKTFGEKRAEKACGEKPQGSALRYKDLGGGAGVAVQGMEFFCSSSMR